MAEIQFKLASDYANNIVHISKAKKGEKYYCTGCHSEMTTVKGNVRVHHFRHNAHDKKSQCTWSDEKTRHKLTLEVIQAVGEFCVPALKIEREGKVYIQEGSYMLLPNDIWIKRDVHEDTNGILKLIQPDGTIPSGYIKIASPDIALVDGEYNPLLFILVNAGGLKVTDELRAIYTRTGTRTLVFNVQSVQSATEIENRILTKKHKTWIYHELENAEIRNTLSSTADGNGTADDEGEILSRESVQCRIFKVREAVRSIGRVMEGPAFREFEAGVRREYQGAEAGLKKNIHRARENTRGLEGELERHRRTAESEGKKLAAEEIHESIGGGRRERISNLIREVEGSRKELARLKESIIDARYLNRKRK